MVFLISANCQPLVMSADEIGSDRGPETSLQTIGNQLGSEGKILLKRDVHATDIVIIMSYYSVLKPKRVVLFPDYKL